jgi:hypothetical protein
MEKLMKKYIIIIFIIIALKIIIFNEYKNIKQYKELKSEINSLIKKRDDIVFIIGKKYLDLSDIISQINITKQEISNDSFIYFICIKLKQIRIDDIDINNRIKDEINSIEFWIAVDKRLYETVIEGDSLINTYQLSMIEDTDNNWDITVTDKKIISYPW